MSWVVRLIVLVPALAGVLGLLARRWPVAARVVAVGSAAAVTVLAVMQWAAPTRTADIDTIGALPLGDLDVPLQLLSDRVSGLVAFVVAVVVLCIQAFTVWYLRPDPRYAQFAAAVSLFAAGMLLVVQSADLVLTLVGWEIMGWCSWLLIGHDSERPAARRAAYKAFLVTRVADIGMVIGLIALAARARTTHLLEVIATPAGSALLTVGLLGVVIGVAGKSGLIPFHDWLPDAMEGPTPASALIHAATMVAAGSYVVARLFDLYARDPGVRLVLALLAAATMVYAAGLAFAQTDVKRLLAYSTLSQVAIMLGALAAAPADLGPGPAVAHFVGHAFFKALLFLAAGWLAVLVGTTVLAGLSRRLRGRGALRWATGIGFAALAGVPPLVGFFTKDTVIDAAFEGFGSGDGAAALVVTVGLLVTVVLTAAYCTRAWLLLDGPPAPAGAPAGNQSAENAEIAPATADLPDEGHHGDHPPISLTAALSVSVLAALTVIGAFFLAGLQGAVHIGVVTSMLSILLIAGGVLGVWALSQQGRRDAALAVPAGLRARAVAGFGADAAYARVGSWVTALARLVVVLDRDVVDAYPRSTAVVARALGRAGERAHRGVPALSLVGLLLGVVVVALLGVLAWN